MSRGYTKMRVRDNRGTLKKGYVAGRGSAPTEPPPPARKPDTERTKPAEFGLTPGQERTLNKARNEDKRVHGIPLDGGSHRWVYCPFCGEELDDN
jgi:hypothetical protein